MYKSLSLTGTKGQRFTNCLGFKQVHGYDGLEVLCWKQLPVPCSPANVWMATSVQEHMRSEERTLSFSHPGRSVNLSHVAQIIKDNGFHSSQCCHPYGPLLFSQKIFMILLFLSVSWLSLFFISLEIIMQIWELETHSLLVYIFVLSL